MSVATCQAGLVRVDLTRDEVALSRLIGRAMSLYAEHRGLHTEVARSVAVEDRGVMAELAVSKALNCYWAPRFDPEGTAPDVANLYQVKSTDIPPERRQHLIVPHRVEAHHLYTLVTVAPTTGEPTVATILGMIRGMDVVRRPEWYFPFTKQRAPSWNIPREALVPFADWRYLAD